MTKRTLTIVTALVLLGSLLTGAVVSGAQQPPKLTNAYVWQANDLSVAYPAGWTANERAGAVSIHPAGLDVSDGFGPELVLFEQAGTRADAFEFAIADFADDIDASSAITARTSVNGAKALRASLSWDNPAASGEMILIAAQPELAVGAAYIVRDSASADYQATLAAMLDSLALNAAAGVPLSSSVASVQLPQAVTWADAGLVLHFPAAWSVDTETNLDGETLYAYPTQDATLRGFVGVTFARNAGLSIPRLINVMNLGNDAVLDSAELTVAGYDAVALDVLDESGGAPVAARMVAIDVTPQDVIAVIVLAADPARWDAFRPTASAMISSVETASTGSASLLATTPDSGVVVPVVRTQPDPSGLPQQSDDMRDFSWDDYGVSLSIPQDWEALPRSEEFDLALVSPEALQTGTGAFVLFQVYPSLGADLTIQDALEAIAADAGSDVEQVGDTDGYGVTITNDAAGVTQSLMLFPYNDHGGALFMQTSAATDNAELMQDVVGSLTIDAPTVDVAAANAAFQQSLEADGTLAYGEADAPVNVREYFSYTCGHCANYTLPLENLFALDVESGRVHFEFAPLISDEKTSLATHATYCAAEQGQGYSVYKALFNDYLQQGYDVAFTDDAVDAILTDEQYGLDVDQVYACIEDETYADAIDTLRASFTDFGLTGTPTVVMAAEGDDLSPLEYVDGSVWSGTIPLEALRMVIDTIIENDVSAQEAANILFEG